MKKKILLSILMASLGFITIGRQSFLSAEGGFTNKSPLADVKAAAINSISGYSLEAYRTEQQTEITDYITEVTNAINAATTNEQVDAILSGFNRYILTIKTDAQLDQEEEEARQAAEEAQEGVYYISSYDDLVNFRDDVNDGYTYLNETVILKNDITVPSGTKWVNGIGTATNAFKGTFDGKNHVISGYSITKEDWAGLFGNVIDGAIKNLNVSDVNVVTTKSRSSSIAGRAERATIENCHCLSGTLTGVRENGGIVGACINGISIKNCSNKASVSSSSSHTGGILGYVYSGAAIIENCTNEGSITSTKEFAGGILGTVLAGSATISSCSNKGVVNSTGQAGGGIVGAVYGGSMSADQCTNEGKVTGKGEGLGGILGYSQTYATANTLVSLTGCTNKGEVTASVSGTGTGGIIGATSTKISNTETNVTIKVEDCTNEGQVTGYNYVGGISGLIRISKSGSYVKNCTNKGNVIALTQFCAGIASIARVDIIDCKCLKGVQLTTKVSSVSTTWTVGVSEDCLMIGSKNAPGYITSLKDKVDVALTVLANVSGEIIEE